MSLIVDVNEKPLPPTDIMRRLRQIDDRLGLRFYPLGQNGGQWALTERWKENDRRRQMIQRGEMAPDADFDMVGMVPAGLSADDALPYIERSLKLRENTKDDYEAMLSRVRHYNDGVTNNAMNDVKAFGRELTEANRSSILGTAKSYQGGFNVEGGKAVGTKRHNKRGLTKSERDAIMDVGA